MPAIITYSAVGYKRRTGGVRSFHTLSIHSADDPGRNRAIRDDPGPGVAWPDSSRNRQKLEKFRKKWVERATGIEPV